MTKTDLTTSEVQQLLTELQECDMSNLPEEEEYQEALEIAQEYLAE